MAIKALLKISVIALLLGGEMATAEPFIWDYPNSSLSPLGKQRVLITCLPEPVTIQSKLADPLYASIDWDGFKERDLVILELRKNTSYLVRPHSRADAVPRTLITHSRYFETVALHNKIELLAKCKNKLEYVLIGKDQTQKGRWASFPPNDELFSLIDAMPMRRFEMRQRAGQK